MLYKSEFCLKKAPLLQMNLSDSGLKNRSIKKYWLIFTVLKFPIGLQFSHNLTKFKIIKYISTLYIMATTCTYLQQLTQVSDVAHGPLVVFTSFDTVCCFGFIQCPAPPPPPPPKTKKKFIILSDLTSYSKFKIHLLESSQLLEL